MADEKFVSSMDPVFGPNRTLHILEYDPGYDSRDGNIYHVEYDPEDLLLTDNDLDKMDFGNIHLRSNIHLGRYSVHQKFLYGWNVMLIVWMKTATSMIV